MTELPVDLRAAVEALLERANVCRLVAFADLHEALPDRALTRDEVEHLLVALAHDGLHVIEPDAAERLAEKP